MGSKLLAEGIVGGAHDLPHLLGVRCAECGTTTFPARSACARCGQQAMESTALPARGRLWTWTTQGFLPKHPYAGPEKDDEAFEPYLLGYIEFPGYGKVESRLVNVAIDQIEIGMEMELVLVPFGDGTDGKSGEIFAFQPVREERN